MSKSNQPESVGVDVVCNAFLRGSRHNEVRLHQEGKGQVQCVGEFSNPSMVGVTGIEPVTPTMSMGMSHFP
jgi:hypothetical protein